MSKLHEVLAVEPDLMAVYRDAIEEAKKTFKQKPNMFVGFNRQCQMFDPEKQSEAPPDENQHMESSVSDKLGYVSDHISRYFNAVYQKEATNQVASSDLVVNGTVLASQVPATFLLGLETKLKKIEEMYKAIPTLPPGIEWNYDPTLGAYKMENPEINMKTAKTFQHKVLYEATDKHPAQIEKWEETVNVGKYVRHVWSGMFSSADKAEVLQRIEDLIKAVKEARMRANNVDVIGHGNIGNALMDYINNFDF